MLTELFIPSLTGISNTLIDLSIVAYSHIPLSFLAKFTNLQKLELELYRGDDFETLQRVTFSQLHTLIFSDECPRNESLVKFLGNNGKI